MATCAHSQHQGRMNREVCVRLWDRRVNLLLLPSRARGADRAAPAAAAASTDVADFFLVLHRALPDLAHETVVFSNHVIGVWGLAGG
jgi:hypothetical protein